MCESISTPCQVIKTKTNAVLGQVSTPADGVKEDIYNGESHALKRRLKRIAPGRLTFIYDGDLEYIGTHTLSIADTFSVAQWRGRQRHCLWQMHSQWNGAMQGLSHSMLNNSLDLDTFSESIAETQWRVGEVERDKFILLLKTKK